LAGRKRLWVETARYLIKFCIVQLSAGACLPAYRILIAHCYLLVVMGRKNNSAARLTKHAGDASKPL